MNKDIVYVPEYVYVTKDRALVVRDRPDAPVFWNDKIARFVCKDARGRYARLEFNPAKPRGERAAVYDLVFRPRRGDITIAPSVELRKALRTVDNHSKQPYYTDIVKSNDEKRYTFGVVYKASSDDSINEDAHRDYMMADDLQQTQWAYVKRGDRTIHIQHNKTPLGFEKAGEWVDICTLPFAVEGDFKKADGTVEKRSIPANSVWMGTLWEPWAWDLVKTNKITGYSFGGSAQRLFDDDED